MQVFGYVRVSTLDQAVDGVSLAAQTDRIAFWCGAKGPAFRLVNVFEDAGVSGKRSDNRPGLQSALNAVCEAKGVLAVYSLSRLSRSVRDALGIAERIDKAGANLVSLTEDIDTTSASGRLFFVLIAAFAQFERDLTSDRTRTALAFKRSKSERIGQIPYGSQLEPDGRTLSANPAELQTLSYILGRAKEGDSLRVIAARLDSAGIPAKNGGQWSHTSIRRILNRLCSYENAKT